LVPASISVPLLVDRYQGPKKIHFVLRHCRHEFVVHISFHWNYRGQVAEWLCGRFNIWDTSVSKGPTGDDRSDFVVNSFLFGMEIVLVPV
jgi:hypothetical protein